jgi:hypothetical protein
MTQMDARIVELVARLTALVSDVQCHQAVTRRSLVTFAYRRGGTLHDLSISAAVEAGNGLLRKSDIRSDTEGFSRLLLPSGTRREREQAT